jgi:hypothetical protein
VTVVYYIHSVVELYKSRYVIRIIKSNGMKSAAELLAREERENYRRYGRKRGLSESVKKEEDR